MNKFSLIKQKQTKIKLNLKNKIILVSGNIGVGKTTLINQLVKLNKWTCTIEKHQENPYLPSFYKDKKRWALQAQLYFLMTLVEEQQKQSKEGKTLLLDRSIYDNMFVFIPSLVEEKSLTLLDFDTYNRLYKIIETTVQKPDLIIYPYASVKTLKQRINLRGRSYEKNISVNYLKKLNNYYSSWLENEKNIPVLPINSEQLNFLDLNVIKEKILPDIMELLKTPSSKNVKRFFK